MKPSNKTVCLYQQASHLCLMGIFFPPLKKSNSTMVGRTRCGWSERCRERGSRVETFVRLPTSSPRAPPASLVLGNIPCLRMMLTFVLCPSRLDSVAEVKGQVQGRAADEPRWASLLSLTTFLLACLAVLVSLSLSLSLSLSIYLSLSLPLCCDFPRASRRRCLAGGRQRQGKGQAREPGNGGG